MSRDQLRYRVALPAALLLIPLAAVPATARTDPGELPGFTAEQTNPGPLQVGTPFTSCISPRAHRASSRSPAEPRASSAAAPGDGRDWQAAHATPGPSALLPTNFGPGGPAAMAAACSADVGSWPRATGRSNQPRGRAVEGLESPRHRCR